MTRCRKILERVAFLVLCLAALAACKKKEGAKCSRNSDCAKQLYCVHTDYPLGDQKCMTEAQGMAACRSTKDCADNGRCSLDRSTGNCLAASAADCLQSSVCKTQGRCEVQGSLCGAKPASTTTDKEASSASSPDKTSTGSSTSSSSCPSGYTRRGNECVKYSCPSGCTYIGGGKCRCRR